MIIFSHPTGNANVRAAASGLVEADLLTGFHTTLASFPGSLLDRLGAIEPLAEIRRRRYDPVLKPFTQTWPWREASRLLASKAGFTSFYRHETGFCSIDAVYRSLDQQVSTILPQGAAQGAAAMYAYEDGAASSFRKAKLLGMQCFYDLPTGYWRAARRLLEGERERWPDWASTMSGLSDSPAKLARKDEELQLADRIFVASQFTADTLKEYPGHLAPIEVIPYGFPPVTHKREYSSKTGSQRLKLLFVGTLTQQKGIADLFAAVDKLGNRVELTVVGHKVNAECPALDAALAKHQWFPTLPHESVLKLMRENDVLLFPSLFDGFGLVITEAMSRGTPVIATNRSAGPDLIQHGLNGWLVEAGNWLGLQSAIEELLSQPQRIALAGKEAAETARSRSWKTYSQELAAAVQNHLAQG